MSDQVQRFMLEDLDIRGAIVSLSGVWSQIQHGNEFSERVRQLLGEMCAVTAVIGGNLKQPGRLTFQLRGHGAISLLVVDCSQSLNLRGFAKAEMDIADEAPLQTLIGDGNLLLSLEVEGLDQPYQSFVPVEGDTLTAVFEHFLEQSEQQPTHLLLAAGKDGAAALFLQKLPLADQRDADGWDRVLQLANTLSKAELLATPALTLLQRLFHEETVRVFDPRAVTHIFPPDWDKVRSILRSIGADEVEGIIAEFGEVMIRDDLSNLSYRFTPEEARAAIAGTDVTRH